MKNSLPKLLSILFFSVLSFADGNIKISVSPTENKRITCSETTNSLIKNIFQTQKGNYLNCQKIEDFLDTIEKVSRLTPVSPEINLFIGRESNNASFDMGNIIYVPLRLNFPNQWGTVFYGDYYANQTILAHEYGHAVLSKLLEKEVFFQSFKAISIQISQIQIQIQELFEKGDPDKKIPLYSQRLQDLQEQRLNDKESLRASRLLSPYHELFADLVTVLAYNDKSSILNALYYNEMSDQSYQMLLFRNFEGDEVNMNSPFVHEEHGMFAPIRRFIGNQLWPNNDEEKKTLIQQLYKAIVIEMRKNLALSDDELDPRSLNQNLLSTLNSIIKSDSF